MGPLLQADLSQVPGCISPWERRWWLFIEASCFQVTLALLLYLSAPVPFLMQREQFSLHLWWLTRFGVVENNCNWVFSTVDAKVIVWPADWDGNSPKHEPSASLMTEHLGIQWSRRFKPTTREQLWKQNPALRCSVRTRL